MLALAGLPAGPVAGEAAAAPLAPVNLEDTGLTERQHEVLRMFAAARQTRKSPATSASCPIRSRRMSRICSWCWEQAAAPMRSIWRGGRGCYERGSRPRPPRSACNRIPHRIRAIGRVWIYASSLTIFLLAFGGLMVGTALVLKHAIRSAVKQGLRAEAISQDLARGGRDAVSSRRARACAGSGMDRDWASRLRARWRI